MRSMFKSDYKKSVATLAVGTAIAQSLPIAISPILTRLYSPQDFGLIALYTSLLGIASTLATLRYELGVVLPKNDDEANRVVLVSLAAAGLTTGIAALGILVWGGAISQLLGNSQITNWLYLLPVSIFLTAAYNTFNYWLNRREKYLRMSKNRIMQNALRSGGAVAFGFTSLGGIGMVVAWIIAQCITTFSIFKTFLSEGGAKSIQGRELKQVAIRYSNHPLHLLPAHSIGSIAMQLPVFILSRAFDSAVTGFYSLGLRLISLPATLIASAIGDVYRQKASSQFNQSGQFRRLYVRTVLKSTLISLPLCLLFYLAAPRIFGVVFGEEWVVAGEYAQILIAATFFQFVFTPVDKGALIVGATRYIFVWHLCRLLGFGGLFIVTISWKLEVRTVLWAFTFLNSAFYIVDGVVGYYFSKSRSA